MGALRVVRAGVAAVISRRTTSLQHAQRAVLPPSPRAAAQAMRVAGLQNQRILSLHSVLADSRAAGLVLRQRIRRARAGA